MATTNRESGNLETEQLAASVGVANPLTGEVASPVAKRNRVLDSVGLFYTYAGATAVTFLGALSLFWGNHQGSAGAQAVGMSLILIGCVVWMVAFAVMTWWIAIDIGPLLWNGIRRARQGLSKKVADGIDNQ